MNGKYETIYGFELDKLKKYCNEIEINVEIIEGGVEFCALLSGDGQIDIFGNRNDSRILITTALETRVKSEGKLDIDASRLKKVIKLVEKAATAFYVACREEQFSSREKGAEI